MGITPEEKEQPSFLEAYQETITRAENRRYEELFPIKTDRKRI